MKKRRAADATCSGNCPKAERLSAVATLGAGIAHEINQPLSALKVTVNGMSYFLDRGHEMDKETLSEKLRLISTQADRINTIILHMRVRTLQLEISNRRRS